MESFDNHRLKTLLDQTLRESDIPAFGATVVRPWGVEAIAVAGVRRFGGLEKVEVNDSWHIGSNTKAMTAALYARLADQGRVAWGATLNDLFPNLADTMDPVWRDITIEQLLWHRAGLDDIAGYGKLVAGRKEKQPPPVQRMELARVKLSKPPAKAVGEFVYSNFGYIIVGAAIERAIGDSWENIIEREVFEPLQMDEAGFGPPQGTAPQGHRITGAAGKPCPVGDGSEADNAAALGPAGTVHLPLEDWSRFVRLFLDREQTFLTQESMARLVTPANNSQYAMGWGVLDDPLSGRILLHSGSNTLWLAHVEMALDFDVAFLITCNCVIPAAQKAVVEITSTLKRALARHSIH